MKRGFRSTVSAHALAVVLLAAATLASGLRAAEPESGDPTVLAATYSAQATELRSRADRHTQMAKMHKAGAGGPKSSHESIARHCERIAANLNAAADESDALAATYRDLARKK